MTLPKRIQLRRTKGWKKPEGAIVVSRPSKYGNPFAVTGGWQEAFRAVALGELGNEAGRRAAAVKLYEWWLTADYTETVQADGPDDKRTPWQREVMTVTAGRRPPTREEIRRELRGRDLACWCRLDQSCHADVLLKLANQ